MVLVPGHQLSDGLLVVLQQRLAKVVEGDRGALRDDNNPALVCQVEDFLRVRVVGGAEAVGTQPLHQVLVSNCQRQIKTLAAHI